MAILTGPRIIELVEEGKIEIDPFKHEHINPASIDLTLGGEVVTYEAWAEEGHWGVLHPVGAIMDVKAELRVRRHKIDPVAGFVLQPNILYLMHTIERVKSDEFVYVLDGKSSLGRLGIVVHLTAGFFDPGFNGQATLEVTVVHPIRIYPGMRFCQMRFHALSGPVLNYQEVGNYRGAAAMGPVPSLAYKQFKSDNNPK